MRFKELFVLLPVVIHIHRMWMKLLLFFFFVFILFEIIYTIELAAITYIILA